jgi:hypothetical protein
MYMPTAAASVSPLLLLLLCSSVDVRVVRVRGSVYKRLKLVKLRAHATIDWAFAAALMPSKGVDVVQRTFKVRVRQSVGENLMISLEWSLMHCVQ